MAGYMGVNDSALQRLIDAVIKAGGSQTSGLRSPEDNKRVGGVPNSYHLGGKASDFAGVPYPKIKSMLPPGYEAINEGDHTHVEPLPRTLRPTRPVSRSARPGGNEMPMNPLYNDYPDIYQGTKAAYGMSDEEKRKQAVLSLINLAAQRGMPQELQNPLFGTQRQEAPAMPQMPTAPQAAPPTAPQMPQATSAPAQFSFNRNIPAGADQRGMGIPEPQQNSFMASLGVDKPYEPMAVPTFEEYSKQRGMEFETPANKEDILKKQRQGAMYGGVAALLAHLFAGKDRRGRKDNRLASGLLQATGQYGQNLQGTNDAKRQALQQAYAGYQGYADNLNKQNYDRQGDYYGRAKDAAELGYKDRSLNATISDKETDNARLLMEAQRKGEESKARIANWQFSNALEGDKFDEQKAQNAYKRRLDTARITGYDPATGEPTGNMIQFEIKMKKEYADMAERARHNKATESTSRANAGTAAGQLVLGQKREARVAAGGGKQTQAEQSKALRGKYISEWDRLQQQRKAYHGDPATISEIKRKEERLRKAWRQDFGSANFDAIVAGEQSTGW